MVARQLWKGDCGGVWWFGAVLQEQDGGGGYGERRMKGGRWKEDRTLTKYYCGGGSAKVRPWIRRLARTARHGRPGRKRLGQAPFHRGACLPETDRAELEPTTAAHDGGPRRQVRHAQRLCTTVQYFGSR